MATRPKIRVKTKTKDKDLGYLDILKQLRKLEDKPFVKVGFPAEFKSGSTPKKFTSATADGSDPVVLVDPNVTVLDAAIWNEFGTEQIPERSFVRSAFDKNRVKYEKTTKKLLIRIYQSKVSVERALDILGLMIENDIKSMIRNGNFKPLSDVTIAKKGSDKPLVDTGQMINSVRFKRIMKSVTGKLLGR